jgi:hypothetical protein
MADRLQSFKAICKGGLNSNENHLALADNEPGAATRLVNFEPSLFGGYRRIEGYDFYDPDYPAVGDNTAEGKVLGVVVYRNEHLGNPYVIAARKDAGEDTYSFWKHTPLVGWSKIATGLTHNYTAGGRTVKRVRFVQFDIGLGSFLALVDGVNPAVGFDGTDWYELTSTGAGTEVSPGGNQIVDAPSVVDFFSNTLFLGGDPAFKSVVCYSAPNDPLNFTAASGAGQIPVGFNVVQIKPFRDNLFVFGGNSIKRISADVTAGFLIQNVTSNVGCIARDSVVEVAGDLVFLAPDGFRPVAGTSRIGDVELETISQPIKGRLQDLITNNDVDELVAVVIRAKSQVRYFFSDGDTGRLSSEGILGGLTASEGEIGWEYGELLGFRASCTSSEYIGREEYVLNGDYDGNLYRQEVGNTFAGAPIPAIFSTPYLDFGDTEVRKVLHKINVFLRPEGPVDIGVLLRYDWGDSGTAVPNSYESESDGAPIVYGGRNIRYGGEGVLYGGSTRPIIIQDIQGSGFSVRATFVCSGVFAPFSIQGLIFEFAIAGRR